MRNTWLVLAAAISLVPAFACDDDDDLCAETPMDLPIDTNGCSGAQLIELSCDPDDYAKHGPYVSCVSHAASEACDLGLIAPKEKARFIKEAAQSNR